MIEQKELLNGFKYLDIKNSYASAKISLQGAHIYEFIPLDAEPILWVSQASNFKYGESIRGGIPVCWPWFGMHKSNKKLPQHGFARTTIWDFIDSKGNENFSEITMQLKSSSETKKMFKYDFELTLIITISKELKLELITKNLDTSAFTITQALHTYFNISKISNISISGLEDKPYLDALDMTKKKQTGIIKIDKEVDRVFQKVNESIKLRDNDKTIEIKNEGSTSVIVWNPWIDKCSRMSAMKKDSYKTFVCIESANAIDDKKEIKPNETHKLQTTISYI